jgi:hypothetical protein
MLLQEPTMSTTIDCCVLSNSTAPHSSEGHLVARIEAEFREMPGLRLTLGQASRLFDIDLNRCERILVALVRAGRLATDGQAFVIAQSGRRSA